MIVFASLQTLCHYKSLLPSKSMPQKSNHDFTEKYPYMQAGTFEPMSIKDILNKNLFSCRTPAFENTSKTHNDIKSGEEVKTIIVVDISLLHSLKIQKKYFQFPSEKHCLDNILHTQWI